MYITRSKTYSQIALSEIKEDLDIDSSDVRYDGRILRLIKSAVAACEDYIQDDVVSTSCILEENSYFVPFTYIDYKINQPNIVVSAITVVDSSGKFTVLPTANYNIEKYSSYTVIRFTTSITGSVLKIYFTSGFATIPEAIKRAISIKVKEFLDVDRSGYISNATETRIFERLLNNYRNLIFS